MFYEGFNRPINKVIESDKNPNEIDVLNSYSKY